jgi:hypothetical protein
LKFDWAEWPWLKRHGRRLKLMKEHEVEGGRRLRSSKWNKLEMLIKLRIVDKLEKASLK